MLKKFLMILCGLICFSMIVLGCGSESSKSGAKISVVCSFYPMAEFTREVGKNKIEVITLVPDGAEPHDWEPSPRDLTKLGRAKLFVFNGIVEPWAENSLEAVKERNVAAVQAGKNLYSINGKEDPHVWVSPKKAMIEVDVICQALCKVDEKNGDFYKKNAADYIGKLKVLDNELQEMVLKARRKSFVTSHKAFGHLAEDYNLQQLAISGISPDAEPTPKDLKNLVKLVKQENIKYIFFETLASPKLAEMLAKETGVKTEVLDPIEGLDEEGKKNGLNYLKIQKQNIESLRKVLME